MGKTSILSAAGTFGRPGIVKIEPVKATIKPAPAEILTSFIVISKSVGAPSLVKSSEKLYCVLAIHIGKLPKPKSVIRLISSKASGKNFAPFPPYILFTIVDILFSIVSCNS